MQPCYDVRTIFSSRHIVWCIKSRARLFIKLSSIVRFSKYLRQGVPYEAENWHAWSLEQYFSKHRFLDICRYAFNLLLFPFLQNFWHEIAATRNHTKFWQRFFFSLSPSDPMLDFEGKVAFSLIQDNKLVWLGHF